MLSSIFRYGFILNPGIQIRFSGSWNFFVLFQADFSLQYLQPLYGLNQVIIFQTEDLAWWFFKTTGTNYGCFTPRSKCSWSIKSFKSDFGYWKRMFDNSIILENGLVYKSQELKETQTYIFNYYFYKKRPVGLTRNWINIISVYYCQNY